MPETGADTDGKCELRPRSRFMTSHRPGGALELENQDQEQASGPFVQELGCSPRRGTTSVPDSAKHRPPGLVTIAIASRMRARVCGLRTPTFLGEVHPTDPNARSPQLDSSMVRMYADG